MTPIQSWLLYSTAMWDSFEIALALGTNYVFSALIRLVHNVRFATREDLKIHHPLSILGIGYQLVYNIGGGVMIIMLLDTTTFIVYIVEVMCRGTVSFRIRCLGLL
jgi:hypothetical protein